MRLKPYQLLVARLPSKKTNRNSMCPCTTLECALLEIRLCRQHNTQPFGASMVLPQKKARRVLRVTKGDFGTLGAYTSRVGED